MKVKQYFLRKPTRDLSFIKYYILPLTIELTTSPPVDFQCPSDHNLIHASGVY